MNEAVIGLLGAVAGALATLAGVIVAWYLGKRAEIVAASQRRLDAATFAAEWSRDLRTWASEAIDVLSEASYQLNEDDTPQALSAVKHYRQRLSALIDRGRFFLPNVRVSEYGQHKPSAFRGYRHSALDPLVAAERALGGSLGQFKDRRHAVIAMKREFVSAVQRILAPDRHNEEVARLIREVHQSRADDPTLGGLLPDEHSVPAGADALLSRSVTPTHQ